MLHRIIREIQVPRDRLRFVFLRWPINIINPVDKTQLSRYTSHRRSTTVSLENYPSIHLILGCVYRDAVSNRNGFMTWKPHRTRHFARQPISCQTVSKSMRSHRLHDQWNRIVLKTLHFWKCFQNDPVLITSSNRCRVNERCNRIETDAVTNETASV